VRAVDAEAGELVVDFDGREVRYDFGELDELVLAYATTIHKAQGSEYPAVVIPVTTQHWPMLQRNLLYTGVTRGRRLVVLVAQPSRCLRKALRKAARKSLLTFLLKCCEEPVERGDDNVLVCDPLRQADTLQSLIPWFIQPDRDGDRCLHPRRPWQWEWIGCGCGAPVGGRCSRRLD
jgi:hypothetical protein